MARKKPEVVESNKTGLVKVRFTLGIGFIGADHEDIREYDPDDLPSNPEDLDKWLHEEWMTWI